MAEGEGTDAIDAAIQSAESLLGSLLVRPPTSPPAQQSLSDSALEPREDSSVPVDVETALFPRQRIPPSPSHSLHSLSNVTSHPDTPTTGSSQPDLRGVPSHLSLHGSGLAGGPPSQLSAGAHAADGSLLVEEMQSLHALSSRTSIGAMTPPPDYDTVYRILTEREKDLELAARIGRSLLQRNELLEAELGSQLDNRQQLEQQLAQLRHALGQKEGLLRLYAQDANETNNEGEGEGEGKKGDWIRALTEECRDLRESNLKLTAERDGLQLATAEIEKKERHLVTQCLEQFSEAKGKLSELRDREEHMTTENRGLQSQLEELETVYREEMLSRQQLEGENESLRDQLNEAHENTSHLQSHVSELQDKYEECSVLLKETQDEVLALKEASLQNSSPQDGDQATAATDHESIVQEIEEALRKEIIAASTLTERPSSPKQYALQRTQAVMATVRAATQAMARRQERLAGKLNSDPPTTNGTPIKPPILSTPMHPFNPIATSSPEGPTSQCSISVGTSGLDQSHLAPHPLSPTVSEAGSTLSLPDEASWLRHQHYVAPEKLQIVKPLEGSVTLLKWKLLASPQLGGATSFFSDASRPGVHVKGWKAAGIVDKDKREQGSTLGLSPDIRWKSLSTNDLSYLASAPASNQHTPAPRQQSKRGVRRGRGIHNRLGNVTASSRSADMDTPQGVNRSHDSRAMSHDRGAASHDKIGKGKEKRGKDEGNASLLQQVGNFFSWSRLGLGGRGAGGEENSLGGEGDTEDLDSPGGGANMGLAGIL